MPIRQALERLFRQRNRHPRNGRRKIRPRRLLWETLEARRVLALGPTRLASIKARLDPWHGPESFVAVGDVLYFTADMPAHRQGYWRRLLQSSLVPPVS